MNTEFDGNRYGEGTEKTFFAAANSGKGFANFYPEIFSKPEIDLRYLIKGGSGTGKSSFMRRVAQTAEKEGFGVEYYRCSSDYTSLDGIVIDGRVAVIDATAPHVFEPRLAGAEDRILDVGMFWNADKLYERKSEIEALCKRKADFYKGAYRFLEGALAVDKRRRELVEGALKRDKLKKEAARLAAENAVKGGYDCSVGICNSIGMKGRYRLDTYEKTAKKLYLVDNRYFAGGFLLGSLADEAAQRGLRIRISRDPVNPDVLDALMLEDSKTAFVLENAENKTYLENDGCRRVNMARFLQLSQLDGVSAKDARKELRLDGRLYDGLLQSAADLLRAAGEVHFEIEEIYKSCMDFSSESRFCESIAADICRFLKADR